MQDSRHGGARPGAGRPRRPPSLAAAMRERYPTEWIVDRAGKLVDHAESEAVRLRALEIIIERSHGKVTDRHEIVAGAASDEDDDRDLDALTAPQLRELLAAEREFEARRAAILSQPPGNADGVPRNHHKVTAPPTSAPLLLLPGTPFATPGER